MHTVPLKQDTHSSKVDSHRREHQRQEQAKQGKLERHNGDAKVQAAVKKGGGGGGTVWGSVEDDIQDALNAERR